MSYEAIENKQENVVLFIPANIVCLFCKKCVALCPCKKVEAFFDKANNKQ